MKVAVLSVGVAVLQNAPEHALCLALGVDLKFTPNAHKTLFSPPLTLSL